jgi:hypothetical protein
MGRHSSTLNVEECRSAVPSELRPFRPQEEAFRALKADIAEGGLYVCVVPQPEVSLPTEALLLATTQSLSFGRVSRMTR